MSTEFVSKMRVPKLHTSLLSVNKLVTNGLKV